MTVTIVTFCMVRDMFLEFTTDFDNQDKNLLTDPNTLLKLKMVCRFIAVSILV